MKQKTILLSITLLLMGFIYSCTQIDIMMPKGPKGDQGLSAYEVWRQEVLDGTISWNKSEIEVVDFFRFLKGKDGKDGQNGKSAYEEWVEFISTGQVDDPHNPGSKWDPNRNTIRDFYLYLTGATGEDGRTPFIGENGNWWIGDTDTGIPAKGKDGKDGKDGLTPYIGQNGNWWIGDTDTGIPAKGKDGKDGKDGNTPYIGQNGNWWIGDTDTGIPAKGKDGKDGKDGLTPYIGQNGNWWIGDTDTGIPAKGKDGKDGKDGLTPYIGQNGNWWIGDTDTGIPAKGKDGKDGKDGNTPYIGQNGNWWIGDTDTGIPAKGKDGKSAYELWVDEVTKRCGTDNPVMDPHNPGKTWPCGKVSLTDFWEYLRGRDGQDGSTSNENEPITITKGKFNVIPLYWNAKIKEYVVPTDGSVIFQVYDKEGKNAPAGSIVKGLPGLDPNLEFKTDADGCFTVKADNLPNLMDLSKRKGVTKTVTIRGETEKSADNTLVPNRINVKIDITKVDPYYYNVKEGIYEPLLNINYRIMYQVNGEWKLYPSEIAEPDVKLALVKDSNKSVNELNVEINDKISKWNRVLEPEKKQMGIARPYVLTEREKYYVETLSGFEDNLKVFQWDGNKRYFALAFGDKEGAQNDYGQVVYTMDKIFAPEIYPICGLKDPKIEIKTGVSTLWGEFEVSELGDFYPVDEYIKDESSNIWSPTGEKQPAKKLPKDFHFMILMSKNTSGGGGQTVSYSRYPVFENSRFTLDSAYPDNYVQIHGSGDFAKYYRTRKVYNLRQSYGQHFFEDYYTKQWLVSIPQQTIPEDWMK